MARYVAKKIVKVGQSHYQPGEEVKNAEEIGNLKDCLADGTIAREDAVHAPALVPPAAETKPAPKPTSPDGKKK